jgi:phospholipase D1/2
MAILQEGRNCWKIAKASRVKFLIDGAAYFAAVADAFELAHESILIRGWDFDSRIHLKLPDREGKRFPDLGRYLNDLTARRPSLQIHILVWDFAMIFALEREMVPFFGPSWRRHPRVHFHMDGDHPVGASHHPKIVVVDDAIAFVGGLDLARGRWDTPEHRPDDNRRLDVNDTIPSPHHDLQIGVAGEVAARLADLIRQRWLAVTGQRLRVPTEQRDLWPASLSADLTDVKVAIARTEPQYPGNKGTREIENLFLDSIGAAQRFIYIENQYLSSAVIGDALVKRLREPNGPEVVAVISKASAGWLEGATMDVLRARLVKRLREADKHRRLRIFCPVLDEQKSCCMSVHSKLLIADNEIVRIGSANLSNRSLGFDTECDLALEAEGNRTIEQAIERLRNSLLAEHLGASAEDFARTMDQTHSLIASIKKFRTDRSRTLELVDCSVPEWLDQMIPDSALLDPETPIAPEKLVDEFVLSDERGSSSGALFRGLLIMVLMFGLAAAWRWTPLHDLVDLNTLKSWAGSLPDSKATSFWMIGAFLLGGITAFPVTVLILATAYAFDAWPAIIYSLVGCIVSAIFLYAIGRQLGRKNVVRFAGKRLNRMNRLISKHGVLAVAAVRMIPVAPYSLVNLAAGAVRVPFRDFVLGTLLGVSPGVVGITLFEDQVEELLRDPNPVSFLVLILALGLMLLGIYGFRRWFAAKQTPARRSMSRPSRWAEIR